MAILWSENGEGGADGATVTTSNSAFTANPTPGANWTLSNLQSKTGAQSVRVHTTTAIGPNSVLATGSARNLVFVRYYLYWTVIPAAGTYNHGAALAALTKQADWGFVSSGSDMVRRIRNLNTQVAQGTTAITSGSWFRIEWKIDKTNSTQEMRLFNGADVDNPAASYTEHITG